VEEIIMEEKVKFERKVFSQGDSLAITLPKEICQYLKVEAGSQIVIMDDNGKKGKFISIWKK
jgi:antitoxin component of MazEF toxin-antitoxin module